jgi:hypothetical protein
VVRRFVDVDCEVPVPVRWIVGFGRGAIEDRADSRGITVRAAIASDSHHRS